MTRSEMFRYLVERSGPKRPPSHAADRSAPVDATPKPKNVSRRAGKKAQFALESSAGRPSRKSTRKAANRQKNDIQFRRRVQTSKAQPGERPRA